MEGSKINLKQYITNGFVRSGVSYFGYALILGTITGGLGYAVYRLHQSNQLNSVEGMALILEYVLLITVGLLTLMTISLGYRGIRSFRQFGRFMKGTQVNLDKPSLRIGSDLQIGIALDYLSDETIVYENGNMVLTNHHVILLEGDPCIQPRRSLKKASLDTLDLKEGKQPKLYQLKTVVLQFKDGNVKKVPCHYLGEAKELLNNLKAQGIKIS